VQGGNAVPPLFDRQFERSQLSGLLKAAPTNITVVLGPRSSGKTALLLDMLGEETFAAIINCRSFRSATPDSFVRVSWQNIVALHVGIQVGQH